MKCLFRRTFHEHPLARLSFPSRHFSDPPTTILGYPIRRTLTLGEHDAHDYGDEREDDDDSDDNEEARVSEPLASLPFPLQAVHVVVEPEASF